MGTVFKKRKAEDMLPRTHDNPYETGAMRIENGPKSPDWVARILSIVLSLIGLFIVVGLGIQVDLHFTFPGFKDPSAGPFYYWPSDTFEFLMIVNIGSSVAFVYFSLLLFLRIHAQIKRYETKVLLPTKAASEVGKKKNPLDVL